MMKGLAKLHAILRHIAGIDLGGQAYRGCALARQLTKA
jgi:hypothetical protein